MPHPEDTLERLAELAREDETWASALERRSLDQSHPGDDALLGSLPAFASEPMPSDRTRALVDSIQTRLQRDGGPSPPASASVEASAKSPRWPRGVWIAGAALTAIAAGSLLWLRTPADIEPLSQYEVHVRGSQRSDRASVQRIDVLRLRPRSELRFELRPRTDVRGAVRARIFVDPADASRSFEVATTGEQSEAGALRISATVPPDLPESGELLLFVGRSRSIEELLATEATSTPPGTLQQFRWRFERTPVAP